jgi:class 3 adenylate cyclase
MDNQATNQAVVFADVSGSTRLYEVLGDKRALECIGLCLEIMRGATLDHGGRVVKTIGDELMGVFPSATAAARAASDMQTKVGMQDTVSGERLAIRVGVHFGPVIEKAGDVFGDCVNVAARMTSLAKAGQIITTKEVVDSLPADLRTMTRSLHTFSVKGKKEAVSIYELFSQRSEDATTLASRPPEMQVRIRLRHNAREVVPEADRKSVAFGRDPASDFVIADKKASRQHARIERRHPKYVLIDMSSNGTYLTFQGQPEIALRREEVALHGRGSISFGHRYVEDPSEVVTFEIE